jgi:hypothetical protein
MSDTAPASGSGAERASLEAGQALQLFAVARARSWRGGRVSRVRDEDVMRVRYRDLEALVRAVSWEVPPLDDERVLGHQRVVESAMRRGTVLPLPYGVIFRGRRPLIRLLQEQYLVIDEALSFLEGHWELRLHIAPVSAEENSELLGDVALACYADLRRHARAAVPLPREGKRLLTAAFLVERATWVEFVERADDFGTAHPELVFDVTGPWPAYDFVRIGI